MSRQRKPVDSEAGKRLRKARQRKYDETGAEFARTAKAFAEAIGVPISTYNQYENGQRNVPEDVATKAAKKLGIGREWILRGQTEPAYQVALNQLPVDQQRRAEEMFEVIVRGLKTP